VKERLRLVDSLRGFALLIMFGYHFAFDLDLFGVVHIAFGDSFWTAYRWVILLLFLGLAGIGIGLAERRAPTARHLARLATGALAISIGTRVLFPDAWVAFGILHFIFAANLLVPPLSRSPEWCAVAASVSFALPVFVRTPVFDAGLLRVLGLGTVSSRAVDFVPLFPWLGVVFLGAALGAGLPREAPWLRGGSPRLAALGRHSLLLYVTHQSVFLPLAWAVAKLVVP
jgi:uncharacterized membrane protein